MNIILERFFYAMSACFYLFYRILTCLVLLALPWSLHATPTWNMGGAVDDPGNLGDGEIPLTDNPAVPGCAGAPRELTGMGFTSIEFNEENGEVVIDYQFGGSDLAVEYMLQYTDGDGYFGDGDSDINEAEDDHYWKEVLLYGFASTVDSRPYGSSVDVYYGVNVRRHYRVVGFDEYGDVVWRSPIGGVMHFQVYDVLKVFSNIDKDNDGYFVDSDISVSERVSSMNFPVRGSSRGYDQPSGGGDMETIEKVCSIWTPRYTEHIGLDRVMIKYLEHKSYLMDMVDGYGHVWRDRHGYEVLGDIADVSFNGYNTLPDMGEYRSWEDIDDSWSEWVGSSTWIRDFRELQVEALNFDVRVSDFRGELGVLEKALFNFDEKDISVRIDVYGKPYSYDYFNLDYREPMGGLAYFENVTRSSKLVVEWSDSNLDVYGYDPNAETVRYLNSPYTLNGSQVSSFSFTWKLTPSSIPSDASTVVTFKYYLPTDNGYLLAQTIEKEIVFIERESSPPPSPNYYNIPISDATGPRYRKIALNGRPIADERPQDANQNDEAKEETYIDAFNLGLVHGVTDIYVPIQGSDLTLSLRRNLTSEIFCENSGLRPTEDPAKPFGACWTSNVCSYVKVVTPQGPDIDQYEEPVRATVIDENGQAFSFVKFGDGWLPMPTSSHEAKSFMTELEEGDDYFLFRHKHGSVLRFNKLSATQEVMRDRVEGSKSQDICSYARLETVTDRMGYQLAYTYSDGDTEGLIPVKIQACRLGTEETVGTPIPGLQIWLRQEGNRVTRVWDPNGNEIDYAYGTVSYDVFDPRVAANVTQDMAVLSEVSFADESTSTYTYEHVTEGDYTPRNPEDLEDVAPYEDPESLAPCDSITQHIDYEHINLESITDANDQTYTFTYGFDHSKETFVTNSVASGYYIQTGNPRYVKKVELPIGESTFELGNNEAGRRMRITTIAEDEDGEDLITDNKTNSVTDAEGFTTTYKFENIQIEVLKQFHQLYQQGDSITRYKDPRILYYTTMRVQHGDLGQEVYTFSPSAGLALASATDLSGNVRNYYYTGAGNGIDVPTALQAVWPNTYSYYDDPTSEKQSVTGVGTLHKYFAYDPTYRKMVSYTDPAGNVTETILDKDWENVPGMPEMEDMGRPIAVRVYAAGGGMPVDQMEYAYGNAGWPGFKTSQTHIGQQPGDPAWSGNLVTGYAPDAQGRVASETIYPTADADGGAVAPLTTTYHYDYNGNLRLATDPKEHSTGFAYDARNRLTRTTFHDDSYIEYTYDKRGNKVLEQDANRHLTGYQYDVLNRRIKVVRDMDGNLSFDSSSRTLTGVGAETDLITLNAYNLVNSLLRTSVVDGPTTRYTYDGIQRVKSQSQRAAENPGLTEDIVTTFVYGKNSGGSVFNVSGFKPTLSVGPRGYRTVVTYDERYQLILSRVEYAQGQFAETKTLYDKNGNPKSVTDPLGHTTLTDFDALNRPTRVTFADATFIETSYTSTRLAWKVVDEMGRETVTEYDRAGRPIVVRQPPVGYIDEGGSWQEAGGAGTGPSVKTFYDAAGNVSRMRNPRGNEWTYTYDARNRQTEEHQPSVAYIDEGGASAGAAQPTIITGYDDVGNITRVTDPRNNTSVTEYDAANRPVYAFTPSVEYWDNGLTTNYLVTESVYDQAGNITETWQGYAGAQSGGSVNRSRRSALNSYDALGRLLATTDAANITVTNNYDAEGNLISVRDGEDQTTTFTYDGLSRNLTTTYGGGDTTTLVYDAMMQTARIDANGHRTDYTYDLRNRLKDVLYAGASEENRSYTYNGVGNIRAVTENKASDTDVEYQYDALNRVVLETSAGVTHRYRYDLAGNRRETVYDILGSNTLTLTSTYDALNRTRTITEGGRTTTYRYDLAGNIRETEQPNSDIIKSTYDSLGRKKAIIGPGVVGSELYVTTNAYDLFGNLKQIGETYPAGNVTARTVTNTYDDANRLLVEAIDWEVGGPDDTVTTYAYDAAHNRTGKIVAVDGVPTSNITYSYANNTLNQLESSTDAISGSETTYTYDANGNRSGSVANAAAGGKVLSYTYDRENRLVKLMEGGGEKHLIDIYPGTDDQEHADLAIQATYYTSTPNAVYRYAYDYRTRRVQRDESGAGGLATVVSFSGGTSVQEYDGGAGTPSVEYIRGSDYGGGIGGLLYSLRGGTPSYKHYNSRGDVVAATDGNSSLTYQAAYEAFGRHGDTASSEEYIAPGATLDRQRANTKDEDPTGLLNEGFRYRDLETGTFITRDPLGFVDGPNLYSYVVQNPWTKFDPRGLSWWSDAYAGFDQMASRMGIPTPITMMRQYQHARDVRQEAIGAYNLMREGGNGRLESGLTAAGVGFSRESGAMDWYEAVQGEKIVKNQGGEISTTPITNPVEVAEKSLTGAAKMTFTGVMGAKLISSFKPTTAPEGSSTSFSSSAETKESTTVTVSRWGREGLRPGDFVMEGKASLANWLKSGKWQPGAGNEFARPSSGQEFQVPRSTLKPPSQAATATWADKGPFGGVKKMLGQRAYVPEKTPEPMPEKMADPKD
ncbi:hypothetical protein H5P28_00130 [Ruficoccus amylovorans]|uniref:Teneurin-like YD-shell domain-containing protein n=1 Tax=Ruficoccus amylovorans TaxID=1804625 RepID=A0A842H971_9BACT|nr:RHS repeat-associated core domain-containing protein [Ruficoccus amylovorans]MBC2592658.1 hypothetical protein [Ruficoccus amylovorans]